MHIHRAKILKAFLRWNSMSQYPFTGQWGHIESYQHKNHYWHLTGIEAVINNL